MFVIPIIASSHFVLFYFNCFMDSAEAKKSFSPSKSFISNFPEKIQSNPWACMCACCTQRLVSFPLNKYWRKIQNNYKNTYNYKTISKLASINTQNYTTLFSTITKQITVPKSFFCISKTT